MKKVLLLPAVIISMYAAAQNVGIGTNAPQTKLQVEGAISSTPAQAPAQASYAIPNNTSIFFLTAVAGVQANSLDMAIPHEGQFLTILNADDDAATFAGVTIAPTNGVITLQYISGAWRLTSETHGGSTGWSTSGNAGTTNGTNFIGTTDNQALDIRTNNVVHERITTKGQIYQMNTGFATFLGENAGNSDVAASQTASTYIGYGAGASDAYGENVFVGAHAAESATTTQQSVAVGNGALRYATTGHNTAVGYAASGANAMSGDANASVGWSALGNTTTGSYNTAIGASAGDVNTTGSNNTYVGRGANSIANSLSNATAIGANTVVAASNSVVLGNNANVGIATSTPASTLDVKGSIAGNYTTVSSGTNYDVLAGDYYMVYTGAGNITFTLPQAQSGSANFKGRTYLIKNSSSGTGTVTVRGYQTGGPETIGGGTVTVQPGNSTQIISNGGTSATGANWDEIELNTAASSGTIGAGWNLSGNAGVNPSGNYIGTSDNNGLSIRTNGTEAIRIDGANQNVGIGSSPSSSYFLDAKLPTAAANTAGKGIELNGQNGGTSSTGVAGGDISMVAGNGGGNINGSGGAITIAGGNAAGTGTGNAGAVTVVGGSTSSSATGATAGAVTINGGAAAGSNANSGGALSLNGGAATSTGNGGSVTIAGGTSPSGTAGAVNINTTNGGVVNIANGTSGQVVNIASDNTNTKTLNIGGTSASSKINLNAGSTGGIQVSTLTAGGIVKADVGTGKLNIATGTDLPSGSGSYVQINPGAAQSGNYNITGNGTIGGTLAVTGTSTLGPLTQTGTANINASSPYPTNIGTGGTGFVTIGNPTAGIIIPDATNIALNTTTGTKIGTGSTQKIGFFGATPVVQQTGDIVSGLSALGLITSGTISGANVSNVWKVGGNAAPASSILGTTDATTLSVQTGQGGANVAGGTLNVTTGAGNGAAAGGPINITAGNGGATSGAGGAVSIAAGNGTAGTSAGGTVTIKAGTPVGTNQNGANIILQPGTFTGSGLKGQVVVGINEGAASVAGQTIIRGAQYAGADQAGNRLTIQATNGTGAGGSGVITFETAPAAAPSSTPNVMAERMRIDNTGNVGIGVVGPGYKLDVGGSIAIANNNNTTTNRLYLASGDANHYIYSTGTSGNQMYLGEYTGVFHFVNTNGGADVFTLSGGTATVAGLGSGIVKASSGTLGLAAASDLSSLANGTFILNQSSQQATSTFNISGNGIMAGKLQVSANATPTLNVDISSTSGSGALGFANSGGTWDHLYMYHDGATAYIRAGGAETGGLALQVGNGGSGTYGGQTYTAVMNLLQNGNVGIGTAAPGAALHVYSAEGSSTPGGNGLGFFAAGGASGNTKVELRGGTPYIDFASGATGDYNMRMIMNTATSLQVSGGTLDMSSNKITSVQDPTAAQDAATKNYVDNKVSGAVTSGTTNVLAKYTSATALGNSSITDNGTTVSTSEALTSGAHVVNGVLTVVGGPSTNSDISLNSGARPTIYPAGSNVPTNLALQIRSAGTGVMQVNSDNAGNVSLAAGGGNVAIGNITPAYKLDVAGNIRTSGTVYANTNGGAYLVGGDDATLNDVNVANTVGIIGAQNTALGSVQLGTAGGTISGATGFVGINTISPSVALDVNGSARVRGLSTAGYVKTDASGNLSSGAIAAADVPAGSGNYINNTTTAQSANFNITGTGTVGTLNFTAPTGDPSPVITARTVPSGQGNATEKTELILFHSNDPANGSGNDQITLRAPALSFQTYNNATVSSITDNNGYNERMYIDPTGNVGIGTTGPGYKLDVNGSFRTAQNNLTILNDYIYVSQTWNNTLNSGYNSNGLSDLWVNYVGYNNSNTQFRNFNIGNGKQANIAWFDGTNKRMSINNAQVANYTLDVAGDINFTSTLKFGGNNVLYNTKDDVYGNIRVLTNQSTTLQDGMYINYNSTGSTAADLRFYANGTNERGRFLANSGAFLVNCTDYSGSGISSFVLGNDRMAVYRGTSDYGANRSSIVGVRAGASGAANGGTGYGWTSIDCAIKGFSWYGNNYSAGVYGSSENDYVRSAGVLGANYASSYWAALDYFASNSANYGLYSTATGYNGTTNTNGGFAADNGVIDGIGGGMFGGIVGSWSRGLVMGQISSGEMFASYNLGNEYTSGYSAEIVNVGEKRVAAYSVTSTDVKVYADGEGSLNGNSVFVPFESDFAQMLGSTPRVTVSPVGSSASLYIKSIDRNGFTIASDNSAQVQFTWIAVGKRVDAKEKPQLPEAIANKSFDTNLKGVMFNENNLEQSATPMWWDGKNVRFDKAPEQKREKK